MSAPKRVLIVEDEIIIAIHIESTLAELGHEVVAAVSLAEAEEILEAADVDLAILDYHLPDGTSEPLVSRLHAMDIPFIICSGSAGLEELSQAFQRTTFLAKPFTTEGLVAAVAAMGRADA